MIIKFPSHLTTNELIADMDRRARCEREDIAHLIADIAEFAARGGHLAAGYSSMFRYGREVLKFSEWEAYLRVEVAELARKYPVILAKLAEGAVHMTSVRLLAPHLRPENYQELLDAASGKTKQEVKELVSALAPRPDAPMTVRWLEQPVTGLQPLVSPSASSAPSPLPAVSAPASPPRAAAPRLEMTPLSPGRCRLALTANRSTYEKFEQARDLLSHAIRDRDPGEVLDRALTLLIKEVERKKHGATDRPRRSRPAKPGSPYVPADVKRAVWRRDGGRCAFVGDTGRRCNETSCVQNHHLIPPWRGGASTVDNVQLRCAAHNRYEAGVHGPAKLKYMGVVSERRASYSAGPPWSGPSSRVQRAPEVWGIGRRRQVPPDIGYST
jgi:hypothetical protein